MQKLFENVHFLLCVINWASRQSVSCKLTWNDGISFPLKIVCRLLQSELSIVHTSLHTHTREHIKFPIQNYLIENVSVQKWNSHELETAFRKIPFDCVWNSVLAKNICVRVALSMCVTILKTFISHSSPSKLNEFNDIHGWVTYIATDLF